MKSVKEMASSALGAAGKLADRLGLDDAYDYTKGKASALAVSVKERTGGLFDDKLTDTERYEMDLKGWKLADPDGDGKFGYVKAGVTSGQPAHQGDPTWDRDLANTRADIKFKTDSEKAKLASKPA